MKRRCVACEKVATKVCITLDNPRAMVSTPVMWRYTCDFHARWLLDVDPSLYVLPLRSRQAQTHDELNPKAN
ncbi:MAG: hypothetical protein AABY46_03975 [Nitrospirota bacterium]